MKKTPLKRKSTLKRSGNLKKSFSLKKNSTLKRTELRVQSQEAHDLWIKTREKALKRDNYKCQICGEPATQVHHIHLRSKRHDLLYHMNNLICLCDKHHFHKGSENYKEQTYLIARSKNMTVDELLAFAET